MTTTIRWRKNTAELYSIRHSSVLHRLNSTIEETKTRINTLEPLCSAIQSKSCEYSLNNYKMLLHLLQDIKNELIEGKEVCTSTSFILPGAIFIAMGLINGSLTVDSAARILGSVRARVRKFMRILAFEKKLEFLIPTNVDVTSMKIYAWVDHVGKDSEVRDMFVLTLYFSFPFDIHRKDGKSEYEPISFLFIKNGEKYIPVKAFARVHYDIHVYDIENIDKIRILFTRYGHTPVVLDAKRKPLNPNIPKILADAVWLAVGSAITKLSGVKSIELEKLKEKAHVITSYKLEKTRVNPFTSKIHPYFVYLKLS
ncbi:MAG: hypothetical protein QXV28_07580 [Ignisphaera sp.]